MTGISKKLIMLAISLLSITSCSGSKYAIYESSERSGSSIVVDPQTGSYWLSEKIRMPILVAKPDADTDIDDDGYVKSMPVYKRLNYFQVSQIGVVLPLGNSKNIIKNYNSICIKKNIDGNDTIELICNLEKEKYEFSFNQDRGVVSFKSDCILEFDQKCTFSLKSPRGLFFNGHIPKEMRQFEDDAYEGSH